MKKYPFFPLLFAVIWISGCKSPRPAAYQQYKAPVKVDVLPTSIPAIGNTVTAGIGEALLTQGDARSIDYLIIPFDQAIGGQTIRKGEYSKTEQNSEYVVYNVVLAKEEKNTVDRYGSLYFFTKDAHRPMLACAEQDVCAEMHLSRERKTTFVPSGFQQTLLYSGKIGNRITLGYREFSNDVARPAFNNDVAYDLSESTILGYKGARLEVIKATNTEITYKVLSSFK